MAASGLLDAGQIFDAEGTKRAGERASSFKNLGFSGARKGENQPAPRRPFLYTRRDASGNPQSNNATSIKGHIKKPRGTTSSEGSVSTI